MDLRAIQAAIGAEQLDGWLFFDHHRRDPLAYRILQLPADLQPTRRWYYFIPASGEPRGLAHRIEPNTITSLPGETHHYSTWTEQTRGIQSLLAGAKRVAMQYSANCAVPYISMVDGGTIELIRSFGIDVIGSANLIQQFEARWSSAQCASHEQASKIMDKLRAEAFAFAGDRLTSGVTEWDVRQFLRMRFTEHGLVTDHGPIVAVNANASNPHYEPSAEMHRSIQEGDLLLIDMWAKLDVPEAVYYDITWTGICSDRVPDPVQKVFNAVTGARDRAIEFVSGSIASGRTIHGYEVDDAARHHIRAAGFGDAFIHRTGHSIGTDVHGAGANMDNFETHDDRRIISDTCFSIEPGIYLLDFGIRSEVNMFIAGSQAVVTGAIQRELVRIG